jgi:hypothetical protein
VSTELQRKPQICDLWLSACFQNERETLDMEHCGLAGNQKLLEPRYGSTLRFRNDQNRLTMCYEDCAVVSSSRMHVQKDAWSGAVRGSVKRWTICAMERTAGVVWIKIAHGQPNGPLRRCASQSMFASSKAAFKSLHGVVCESHLNKSCLHYTP